MVGRLHILQKNGGGGHRLYLWAMVFTLGYGCANHPEERYMGVGLPEDSKGSIHGPTNNANELLKMADKWELTKENKSVQTN